VGLDFRWDTALRDLQVQNEAPSHELPFRLACWRWSRLGRSAHCRQAGPRAVAHAIHRTEGEPESAAGHSALNHEASKKLFPHQ